MGWGELKCSSVQMGYSCGVGWGGVRWVEFGWGNTVGWWAWYGVVGLVGVSLEVRGV